jgi:hypothetical protein
MPNKVNFDINTFDWSSIEEDETILSVKGPFTWLKINWLLGIIRVPFIFVGVFTSPLLLLDLVTIIPSLYGLYNRKKWAYFLLLISLGLLGLISIISDPASGIIFCLIYVAPNFIYHSKREKLFSSYDGRFDNYINKEKIEDSYENVASPTKKIVNDYKIDEKIDSAFKATKSKLSKMATNTEKIVNDYKIDEKIDSAFKATKSKLSKMTTNADNISKERSVTVKLRELKSLLDDGIINQDEFDEKKSELLKKL